MLELRPGTPARWEIATLPGRDAGTLEPDEVFGFPADAGMAAFAASDDGRAIERRVAREGPGFECFMTSPEHEVVFGLGHDEPFADRPIPEERVRAVMFPSGRRDGSHTGEAMT